MYNLYLWVFSVFTSIMTYKKNNLGLRISTAEIYFARFWMFSSWRCKANKSKKFKTAYPWSAPIMTYLGLVGSKSPPLKYSWVPLLLLLLILASNMGSIAQESRSNHVPYFTECLIPRIYDWLIRLIEDVLEYGFPSGYEIMVQRPCLLLPKGERWVGVEVSVEGGGAFPEKGPLIGLKPWGRDPPSRASGELDSIIHTHIHTH